jgi:uncharacterized protein YuzE
VLLRSADQKPDRRLISQMSQLIVSEGVVIDYDARGNLVGIDIDNASTKVDMGILKLSNLPGKVETVAA